MSITKIHTNCDHEQKVAISFDISGGDGRVQFFKNKNKDSYSLVFVNKGTEKIHHLADDLSPNEVIYLSAQLVG